MSEEIPEKVETQPEEPAAKKKTARKRTKAPEAKPVETDVSEPKRADEPVTPAAERSSKEESSSSEEKPAAEAARPEREEGETATENPSIRRISSKRTNPPEPRENDDSQDQGATIAEPPSADGQGKKRRRRRRKGPGSDSEEGPSGNSSGEESRPQRSAPRVQLDPDKVAKKAWKIFLSEVSEEGLALVSDQDAKEIGRRSFRLAEIFLEEASKR